MAIGDIRALAKAINRRRLEYTRRHAGMAVPITDTLSRILEHDPEYKPLRPRSESRARKPLKNPGIFTVQAIAGELETTVGELLGESGYKATSELLTIPDRRKLRDVTALLTNLFDLHDPALEEPQVEGEATDATAVEFRFPVAQAEFIARDHDYPRALHAWVVPESARLAAGKTGGDEEPLSTAQILHSVREVWDERLQVVRVIGDSMADDLLDGWKVLVDTARTTPANGEVVAVYLRDEGSILGYWHEEDGHIELQKANAEYDPILLGEPDEWILWGTVVKIIDAPVGRKRR